MVASKKKSSLPKAVEKKRTSKKTTAHLPPKVPRPRKKSRPIVPLLVFLLIGVTLAMGYFGFRSYQEASQNKSLEALVKLLTPTQSPLLKDYMTDEIFSRPNDLPVGTSAAKMQIPIIMYHYVEHVKDQNDLTRRKLAVSPETLDQQLTALKEANYDTYFARDIPDLMSGAISSKKFVILTFDDGYEDFYTNVYPILKRHNMRATNYVIANFIGRHDFMNPKQIQELIDSDLVEIGSHTLNHYPLKTMSDEEARKEIFDSKQKLETQFNIKIKTFAYPSGSFNMHSVELVKQAGYVAALSTIYGTEQSPDNLFYLSRVRPGLFNPVK